MFLLLDWTIVLNEEQQIMTSLTSPQPPLQELGAESPAVPPAVPPPPPELPLALESDVIDSATAMTAAADAAASDLAVIRDLLLKAYPDVVPDLVNGDSTASLLASVEPAREAYARVLATIQTNPSGLGSRSFHDIHTTGDPGRWWCSPADRSGSPAGIREDPARAFRGKTSGLTSRIHCLFVNRMAPHSRRSHHGVDQDRGGETLE